MANNAQPLRIGPFDGGLNLASDPANIADNELVECDNLEVDIDGSLVSRPAIVEAPQTTSNTPTNLVVIGRGNFPGGQRYIFASRDTAEQGGIYMYTETGGWSQINSTLRSSVAVQFMGYVWFVPKPGTKITGTTTTYGGRWSPATGFVTDANMPEGQGAIFHKSRMFITPGPDATTNISRLRFTDALDPAIDPPVLSWAATNVIDVQPGDGQNLMDLIIYNDNIMLFKSDSTYLLAYETTPDDAIIRTVNTVIGVSSSQCIAAYENSLYIYHKGKVYELFNYDFDHINIKVPFDIDTTVSTTANVSLRNASPNLSVVGDRLIVSMFYKMYVYQLKSRTWSTWTTQATADDISRIGPWIKMPDSTEEQALNPMYVTTDVLTGDTFLLYNRANYARDRTWNGTTYTDIPVVSKMETKHFDFADSHHFKKLMWWGADVIAPTNVKGTVIPYNASNIPTWLQVQAETWTQLGDNTWNQPLNTSGQTTTNVTSQIPLMRVFVKFLKTIRFRMVGFKLEITHNAQYREGPVRIYSLTAIVNTKKTVAKQVN